MPAEQSGFGADVGSEAGSSNRFAATDICFLSPECWPFAPLLPFFLSRLPTPHIRATMAAAPPRGVRGAPVGLLWLVLLLLMMPDKVAPQGLVRWEQQPSAILGKGRAKLSISKMGQPAFHHPCSAFPAKMQPGAYLGSKEGEHPFPPCYASGTAGQRTPAFFVSLSLSHAMAAER